MKPEITIAAVQSGITWENAKENCRNFEQKIRGIYADIILLPEMFSTGFSMNTKLAEPEYGMSFQWMHEMADITSSVVCGSIMTEQNGRYYNRFYWMEPGGKHYFYNKAHLFSLAGEENHYTTDHAKVIIEWEGWKIAPFICYDLRFPVFIRRTEKINYDLALFVASWPERRSHAWNSLLVARAIENQAYVAAVNRVGTDGNAIPHCGDSMILDAGGKIVAKARPFKEEVIKAVLSKEELLFQRRAFPFFKDRDAFQLEG